MSENTLDIPAPYSDDAPLTAAMLDAMMVEIESWGSLVINDHKQLRLDLFKAGYSLDGDGNSNLVKSLQGQIEMPDQMVYFDDFMEAAAALSSTVVSKAHWTGGGTSGTQAIVAGVGGWMELDTTATGSGTSTLTFTTANFDTLQAPKLEFSLKTSNITNTKITAGWYASANDYVHFEFNTATHASNIYLVSKYNGGTEVSTDTGIDLAASAFLKFKIEIAANGALTCSIDDQLVATSHTSNTVMSLATFKPLFYVDNKAAAESKKLDIDYVRMIQERL